MGYLDVVNGELLQFSGGPAFLDADNTWTGANSFTEPVVAINTFDINAETGGEVQKSGLYIADLGTTLGSTGNPLYTAAICGQISTSRSIALTVDGGGYLWGYRKHTSTSQTYTFQSKVKQADNANKLAGRNLSEPNAPNTVVQRTSDKDIRCRLLRPEFTSTNSVINYIMTQRSIGGAATDNYVRSSTTAQFRASVTDPYYPDRPVWTVRAASYTCDSNKRAEFICIDAFQGTFNLTLPANPTVNDIVVLVQIRNTWVDLNPVIVRRNGQRIMQVPEDMTLDIRIRRVEFTFISSGYGWVVTNT